MAGRNGREPGDKLLPKVTSAVIQSVIATKKGLTGHEYNLRVNAGQTLIDRMGHEVADLFEPFLRGALQDERLSPEARTFLAKATSGRDQWQAVAGMAFGASGVPNVLSQIIGNELAPVGYDIIETNPHLIPDLGSVVTAYVRRTMDEGTAQANAAKLGYGAGWFSAISDANWSWPSPDVAYVMFQRGLIDDSTLDTILRRNGIPEGLVQPVAALSDRILSPADAALAVLRGDITKEQGYTIANANGYSNASFDIFLDNTGEPPGPQELGEALRRGFIDRATFTKGILQSRVRDEWVQTLLDLRYSPLSTADAVNAYVEGYITEDDVKSYADQNGLEPEQYKTLILAAGDPLSYTDMMRLWRYDKATADDVRAALKRGRLKDDYIDFALALKDNPMSVADAIEASIQGYLSKAEAKTITAMNGLRDEDFEPLWSTAGSPASRTEMVELWRRGQVTQQQVEDALRQSRLKDEYIPEILKLKLQLPALYETRTLLADGSLTAAEGTEILLAQGYSASIVKAIVAGAVGGTTTTHKALTEAIYADLYKEKAISADQFQEGLSAIGYSEVDSHLIQEVYDHQLAITQRNSVISKIRAAYTGHRIQEQDAANELNELGIPATMIEQLIADWDIIISTEVKLLSVSQVADLWFMDLWNPDDAANNTTVALDYLVNLGYSADDAIHILEIKNKGALTDGAASKPVSTPKASGSTSTSPGAS